MRTTTQMGGVLLLAVGVGCAPVSAHDFHAKSGRQYAQLPTTRSTDGAFSSEPLTSADPAARVCVDIPVAERSSSPLQRFRVLDVVPLREPVPPRNLAQRLVGARIYLLASPGLTKEWLGHLIECYIALHAGSASPTPDPLAVTKVMADVTSTTNGFVVTLTSRDLDDAERIRRESEALVR
jgi:hypothetical protein